jgi:hypothetical protein
MISGCVLVIRYKHILNLISLNLQITCNLLFFMCAIYVLYTFFGQYAIFDRVSKLRLSFVQQTGYITLMQTKIQCLTSNVTFNYKIL